LCTWSVFVYFAVIIIIIIIIVTIVLSAYKSCLVGGNVITIRDIELHLLN